MKVLSLPNFAILVGAASRHCRYCACLGPGGAFNAYLPKSFVAFSFIFAPSLFKRSSKKIDLQIRESTVFIFKCYVFNFEKV